MDVEIRRGGSAEDVKDVVRINREVFEPEYGLDPAFADELAVQLAELRRSGWPGEGEGLWIAEQDGRAVGGVTLRTSAAGSPGSATSRCGRRRAGRASAGGW